ncbi:putative mitogen-activated protein kinase kinase kinase STE-STE11 family [Rosa chinensis]|uniref:mitogen-activated protein kinase kinase kinase n=1 Tax=Rosa chinensis TaxID=74649 RepID=A0A2P6SGM0_ROSCH|nr:putative mitogen-activated protein kinase kinase kinase STE-STE11 family [Rosa chinensis]
MKAVTSILHKVTGSQSPIRWDEHDLTLIGSGSSGRVFLGKDQSRSPIAVKEAHIRELDEVKLLQKLSHKNIVKYLREETKEETSYILLEYVPGGSIILFQHI